MDDESGLLSHTADAEDLDSAVARARDRIAAAGPEYGEPASLRADLEQWQQCPLGQWMLRHGGWDARWTRYCIGYDPSSPSGNEVEDFFLSRAPAIVATRERAGIFTRVLADLVRPGVVAMSVPCGLMDDLLALPAANRAAGLIGADLDAAAVTGAADNAERRDLLGNVILARADAWDLSAGHVVVGDAARYRDYLRGGVDVLTSNGLNIYVSDDDRVVDLYRAWRRCVAPSGHLVVSALTPPEEWDLADAVEAEVTRARGLMLINGVMWANYRAAASTVQQLRDAGFEVEAVLPDRRGVFPTFVARAV